MYLSIRVSLDMGAVMRENRAGAVGGRDPPLSDDAGAPVDVTASMEVSIDGFWEAGEGLGRFAVHPSVLDGKDVVVQRLGTSPLSSGTAISRPSWRGRTTGRARPLRGWPWWMVEW